MAGEGSSGSAARNTAGNTASDWTLNVTEGQKQNFMEHYDELGIRMYTIEEWRQKQSKEK
jgi:hypothetical protein